MLRIDHHHDDELARLGYPWTVVELGKIQQHFRTHRDALTYCNQRMNDEHHAADRIPSP